MKIKYLLYSVLTTAVLSGCIDVLYKKDLYSSFSCENNSSVSNPIIFTNDNCTTF